MRKAKQPQSGRRKLPVSMTPVVFAFFMSSIMAVLMCLIITAVNQGVGDGYLLATVQAYQIAMPSAFICVMLVRPLVTRLVSYTVEKA